MSFQLEMEFVRMTRVNFVDCLKAFWTRQRIEVAVKMLRKDKTVQDIVACVEGTNVTGNKLFWCLYCVTTSAN